MNLLTNAARRDFIVSTVSYFFGGLPSIVPVPNPEDLMLVLCGVVLGTFYPPSSDGQLGPTISSFLSGAGDKLFKRVVEKLDQHRTVSNKVSLEFVDDILKAIEDANIKTQLTDTAFLLEMRNLFSRVNFVSDLVSVASEASTALILKSLSSQPDLLTMNIASSIRLGPFATSNHAIMLKELLEAVVQAQGKRTLARPPVPPSRHIFISYARSDGQDLARKLHDSLEADYIEAWLDVHDIKPGEEWDVAIQAAIEDSRLFVFIVTPGSVESKVCANEWTHALSTHKKLILALWVDAPVPMRLNRSHYIDFRPASTGFKYALAELRLAIDENDVSSISPTQISQQERNATVLLNDEREKHSRIVASVLQDRFINPLPQNVVDRFKDRDSDQAKIVNWFKDGTRLVGIYGRGGVGKTALACKVLGDLQRAEDGSGPKGMVCLGAGSGGSTGISLERIFTDFTKLLSGEARQSVEVVWRSPSLTVAQKISTLLHELGTGTYILLLDNLEILQDPSTHELIDPDLQTFFEVALAQSRSLSILVTSREPLKLPNTLASYESRLSLAEGLPIEYAVALLRDLDNDGEAGLRNASEEKLIFIAQKTRGFPRALEAVTGLLKNSTLINLDDLLQDTILLANEVTPVIVQQAIVRLPPEAIRVMEGLALFGRPVSQGALEYLLAPYSNTSSLNTILDGLVSSYFVSFNRATRVFSLHPIDREYCYYRIAEGERRDWATTAAVQPQQFTRYELHFRAAEFYEGQRKPKVVWHSINDLEAQLNEFEHRVACGDTQTAALLLMDIDNNLLLSGHYRIVANLYERLLEQIGDPRLRMQTTRRLAEAYYNVGKIALSIHYDKRALTAARRIRDLHAQATCLGGLGFSHSILGKTRQAMRYYKDALDVLPLGDDEVNRAWYLNGLGLAYFDLGEYRLAFSSYMKGRNVARKQLDGSPAESMCLGNAGEALIFLNRYEHGKLFARKAIEIATPIDYTAGLAYFNYFLALADFFSDLPDLVAARNAAETASRCNEPVLNHFVWALLGSIAFRQGDTLRAAEAFRETAKHADMLFSEDTRNCNPLDSKGIALAGLALCGDTTQLSQALMYFKKARKINKDRGIVDQTVRVFNELAKADAQNMLSEILSFLSNYLYNTPTGK